MEAAVRVAKTFKQIPILEHVYRGLITRGANSDLLNMSLTKDQRVSNIKEVFESRKHAGQLTVGQFTQMER